jgi:hypothetical protein
LAQGRECSEILSHPFIIKMPLIFALQALESDFSLPVLTVGRVLTRHRADIVGLKPDLQTIRSHTNAPSKRP